MHLILTNKAKEKLLHFAKDLKKESFGVRIAKQCGCAGGSEYSMDFSENSEEYEVEIEANGIKIFIDEEISKNVETMKVDYLSDGSQNGFKISTPGKKKEGCCGNGCCD